jgi:hypothetical protein
MKVSWIFALLLAIYGFVRMVLWVRGQVRYWMCKHDLVQPAKAREVPQHLSRELAGFFAATDDLRLRLVDDLRKISIVLITDPDVPLGQVRDGRFRWAVLDAWLQIRRWLSATQLHEDTSAEFMLLHEELGLATGRLRQTVEFMRPIWWQAVRARALDPFDLEQVRSFRGALGDIVAELEGIQEQMTRRESHPYRGSRLATAHPAIDFAR